VTGGLVVLTDVPTPYREPVFRELQRDVPTTAVYVTQRSTRDWEWWRYLGGHDSRFLARERPSGTLEWIVACRNLVRVLGTLDPRSLVIGGWSNPTSAAALAWARWSRVPVAVWVESTAADLVRHRLREATKSAYLRATRAAIVPGSRSAEYVRQLGCERVIVAPNAVDNDLFTPAHGRADHLPAQILFVGRLAPEKGLDVLLAAMERLGASQSVALTVIGDGPLRASIERRVAGSSLAVSVVGAVRSPREVAAHLATTDLLVLPSRSEPWGLVVNEAVAARVPVVVSDVVGCAPDLVVPGVTGAVFRSGDDQDLARAITEALCIERDERFESACADIADAHSPAACARGFVEFHRSVTG
jgi:glycosyltransferase involved in cell wall biosynthesis